MKFIYVNLEAYIDAGYILVREKFLRMDLVSSEKLTAA